MDQLKPYHRPVGESSVTDVNFDIEKHIAENVIRHENAEAQNAGDKQTDGDFTSIKRLNPRPR